MLLAVVAAAGVVCKPDPSPKILSREGLIACGRDADVILPPDCRCPWRSPAPRWWRWVATLTFESAAERILFTPRAPCWPQVEFHAHELQSGADRLAHFARILAHAAREDDHVDTAHFGGAGIRRRTFDASVVHIARQIARDCLVVVARSMSRMSLEMSVRPCTPDFLFIIVFSSA